MHNAFDHNHTFADVLDICTGSELKEYTELYNYVCSYLRSVDIENIDLKELREVLEKCSKLMKYSFLDDIFVGLEPRENLHYLVTYLLNKEVNGEPLGDTLIKKSIKDARFFTAAELDYDLTKEYKRLGLERIPMFEKNKGKSTLAVADAASLDIIMYLYDTEDFISMGYTEQDIRNVCAFYLKVVRHEIGHIKEYLYQRSINSVKYNDMLDIEKSCNKAGFEHSFHDYYPIEYYADMMGYESALNILNKDYQTVYAEDQINYLKMLFEKRHNNYPDNPYKVMLKVIQEKVLKQEIDEKTAIEIVQKIVEFLKKYEDTEWKEDDSYIKRLTK